MVSCQQLSIARACDDGPCRSISTPIDIDRSFRFCSPHVDLAMLMIVPFTAFAAAGGLDQISEPTKARPAELKVSALHAQWPQMHAFTDEAEGERGFRSEQIKLRWRGETTDQIRFDHDCNLVDRKGLFLSTHPSHHWPATVYRRRGRRSK